MPRLSVVVITKDRVDLLRRHLRHHLESLPRDSSPAQLIVVDNASEDGTGDWIARTHPEVTLLALSANTGPFGRNIGAAFASTRYVAFSDDDSWWEPGALDEAADFLDANPGVGLVAGSARVGRRLEADPINHQLASSPVSITGSGHREILGFLAFAAVARRELFIGGAGFPLGLGVGGEEELVALDTAAAGWSLVYLPRLQAQHHPGVVDDRPGRLVRQARNEAAIAWARRRKRDAWDITRSTLRGVGLRRVARELATLPRAALWAARNRRELPPRVEMARRRAHET